MSTRPSNPEVAGARKPAADPTELQSPPVGGAPEAKPKKPGRWRRRIKWSLITVVTLAVLLRIALGFALPHVLSGVASAFGMNAHYDHLSLSLTGGEARIWNLRVIPKDPAVSGGEPVFTATYLRGDISPLALLQGRIVVWRAEADTLELHLERRADGSIPVLDLVMASLPAVEPDPEPAPLSFTAPLAVDALRLNRVRAHIRDDAVEPPLDTTVDLNVHVSKLGPDAPQTEVEIDVFAPGLLDVLKIRAQATAQERELSSSFTLDLFGLRPAALAGYLERLGLRPSAQELTARMTGTLKTTAVPGDDRAIDTLLVLENIACTEDGVPDLSVRQVRLEAPYVGPKGVDAREVLVDGVRFAARRNQDGTTHLLGVELGAKRMRREIREGRLELRERSGESAESAPQALAQPATLPVPLSFKLAQFNVRDLSVSFTDRGIAPPAQLTADLLEFSVRDLAWPAPGEDSALPFEAALAAPGIARSARASGEVRPYGQALQLVTTVAAEGIAPAAIEPYLRAAGIQPLLREGYFSAQVEASLDAAADGMPRVSASLRDVSFTDGAGEARQALVLMPEVQVGGLALLANGTLRVDELRLRGPSLDVVLEPDGAVTAAGFRMIPAPAPPSNPTPEDAAQAPPQEEQLPAAPPITAIDLGRVSWEGFAMTLTDAAASPPLTARISDAGVEVRDLRIDIVPPAEGVDVSRTGSVAVRLRAPELVERFEADGTLSASAGTLDAKVQFRGEGITLSALRPLLARHGVEAQWQGASITGVLAARSVPEEGALLPRLDVELSELSLRDGEAELAGLDSLVVDQFVVGQDGAVRAQAIETVRPRIVGSRGAGGSITLAGIRLASPPQESLALETAPSQVAAQVHDAANEPPTRAYPLGPLVLPPVAIGQIRLSDASLAFHDEMRPDSPDIALGADLEIGRLDTIDPAALDTPFTASLRGPGLDVLRAGGTLGLRADEQRLVAEVTAEGIDGSEIAALLPPGIELAVTDGVLRLAVEAQLRPGLAEGGLAARLALSNFDWREGAESLAAMESLAVDVTRLDLSGGAVDVAQATVAGLESSAMLGADGSLTIAGVRMTTPPAGPEQVPAGAPPVAVATGDAEAQEIPVARQDAAADTQQVRAALAQAAQDALPRVTLQEIDLHLSRFAITDASRPAAAPLVLQDIRVSNPEPIVLDAEADEAGAPAVLAMTGAIEPVVGRFSVDVRSQPFARSPTLNLTLRAQGIRGEGLVELAPELAQQIDASGLTDGRFALDLEGRFDVQRRGGIPDLASGIGGELLVRDITFRNGEDGPVLLGLDELEAERLRFEPRTGALVVGVLELRTPRAQVALDERGFHAAGLVLLTEPAAEKPAEAAAEQASARLAQGEVQAAPEPPATAPSLPPEIRIDSLRISGVDFTYEDRTVDPPLVAPVNNLDVDVRGLSSRMQHEPRMVRFSVLANSGQVELPRPPRQSGLIGAVGDVGRMLGGGKEDDEPVQMEKRDLFAQFSTNGRVQLYPAPDGRINLSLTGFELLSLRGLAQTQDVVIGNGVLDVNADVKLNPDQTMDLRTKSALTTLRVSEPKDGPIYRYLRLPAPLDTVIVILQDAGGTITLPVSVTVEQGQIGNGELVPALAGALSQVIATAIVQSPMKVAGGAMSLIGISGGQRGTARHEFELSFEPGSTQLDSASARRLAQARELMAVHTNAKAAIRHRLGAQDVPLLEQRANPSTEQALAVAARLRAQRDQLLDERAELVGHARSAVAFGTAQEATAASEALREADARTAQLDQSIDAALEMLSPGAARRADRRTRTTAISLGQQRLEMVEALLGAGERAQKANAQFDPPESEAVEGEPARPAGGVIQIEIVYPRGGRDWVPYVPFL